MLVIMGLIGKGVISMVGTNTENRKIQMTQTRLDKIEEALISYYRLSHCLPKPAKMNLSNKTADFGVSIKSSTSHNSNDEWVEVGTGVNTVLIGAVPTRTLGLLDTYMYDGWDGQITYAVIKDLANNHSKFKLYLTTLTNGVIQINDINNNQINPRINVNPVAYALVAHGKDGFGTLGLSGNPKASCSSQFRGLTNLDQENCDKNDVIFIYNKELLPESHSTKYYYDFVRWRQKAEFDFDDFRSIPTRCRQNWSYVPAGILPDGTHVAAFCVMTFDVRENTNIRTSGGRKLHESRPEDSPKVNVTFDEAKQFCNDLNSYYGDSTSSYKLITESQWLSLAGKIINIDENWSGGKVLSGKVKVGGIFYGTTYPGVSYKITSFESGDVKTRDDLNRLRIYDDKELDDKELNESEMYIWDLASNSYNFTYCDITSLCDKSTGLLYSDVNDQFYVHPPLSNVNENLDRSKAQKQYSFYSPLAVRPMVNGTVLTDQAGIFWDYRYTLEDSCETWKHDRIRCCVTKTPGDCSSANIKCGDTTYYAPIKSPYHKSHPGNHCSKSTWASMRTALHVIARGGVLNGGVFSFYNGIHFRQEVNCSGWTGDEMYDYIAHSKRHVKTGFRCTGPPSY